MLWLVLVYTTGAVALIVSAWVLRRRYPGRRSIVAAVFMMVAAAFWLATQIAESVASGPVATWVAVKMQFGAMLAVAAGWIIWVLLYTRHRRWVTRGPVALLLAINLVFVLLMVSNGRHHLIWEKLTYGDGAGLIRSFGPGYWVIWGYLYLTFALGTALLLKRFLDTNHLYRWEISVLLLASVVPWAFGLLDTVDGVPHRATHATMVALALSSLLVAWLLFRLRSRHIIPVAHRAILDNLADAVIVIDASGKVIDANAAGRRVFHMDVRDFVNQPLRAYWPDMPALADIKAPAPGSVQEVRVPVDSEVYVFDSKFSRILDSAGRPISYVIVLRDITDRKRAECERDKYREELEYARRLESLALFAGGMAHEFNNVFTRMLGHTSLALEDVPAGAPVVEHLFAVERAVEQASAMAAQILAYSGKGHFVIQPLNLSELLLDCRQVFQRLIAKEVRVEWQLAAYLPDIVADSMQVRLMVTHLLTNASEALGTGAGQITVSTGTMRCSRHAMRQAAYYHPEAEEGRYAYIDIADTGCGMDPCVLSRIFDPFFSTKFTGRGLGLAAVLGIVRGHKGCIFIQSKRGAGTAVRACLPALTLPTASAPQEPAWPQVMLAH
jgi:PAS domain S-box-containing protein